MGLTKPVETHGPHTGGLRRDADENCVSRPLGGRGRIGIGYLACRASGYGAGFKPGDVRTAASRRPATADTDSISVSDADSVRTRDDQPLNDHHPAARGRLPDGARLP